MIGELMERIGGIEEKLNNGGEKHPKEHKPVEVKHEVPSDDKTKRARRTAEEI